MSSLIDDVARTLASPMPRRQALRFLSGAIISGVLGTLGLKEAGAQTAACPKGTTTCGSKCCAMNQPCCVSNTVCCGPNQVCCGAATTGAGGVCCKQNQCVNGRCKASS